MRVEDAAQRMGKSTKTVYRYIERGLITGRKVMGPRGEEWSLDADSVERLRQRHGPAPSRTEEPTEELLDRLATRLGLRELMEQQRTIARLERELAERERELERLRDELARTPRPARPWWRFWHRGAQ